MADTKLTGLTANTTPDIADILYMVDAPGTVPLSQKITFSNYLKVINGLTVNAGSARNADYVVTYNAAASDVRKVLLQNLGAYEIRTGFQATAPADATNYYFGAWDNLTANSNAAERKMYITRAGYLLGADVLFRQTGGSAETSTMYVRVNNTTDYTISAAIVNNATETHVSNLALNSSAGISLSAGDYIEIKWLTPTWVTNPTGVYCQVRLLRLRLQVTGYRFRFPIATGRQFPVTVRRYNPLLPWEQ